MGDLDGDGDVDAFLGNAFSGDQANEVWLNDGQGEFTDSGQEFGDRSTQGVALGDLDGNGRDTVGLFDPDRGIVYLQNDHAPGHADVTVRFQGTQGDWQPVAGEWGLSGNDTVGLYDPVTGRFLLKNTNDSGPADVVFRYGPRGAGWTPLAGNWQGLRSLPLDRSDSASPSSDPAGDATVLNLFAKETPGKPLVGLLTDGKDAAPVAVMIQGSRLSTAAAQFSSPFGHATAAVDEQVSELRQSGKDASPSITLWDQALLEVTSEGWVEDSLRLLNNFKL